MPDFVNPLKEDRTMPDFVSFQFLEDADWL